MALDIVYAIVFLLAAVHGWRRGIIHSIVSLLAIIIGLMAAVSLSELAARYIDQWFNVSGKYLPLIAFVTVFILLYLLFRLAEKAMEGFFKMIKLNFVNQAAGALIWGVVWTLLYSTILFYLNNMELLSDSLKQDSVVYGPVHALAPDTFALIGRILPPAKHVYEDLDNWFEAFRSQHAS